MYMYIIMGDKPDCHNELSCERNEYYFDWLSHLLKPADSCSFILDSSTSMILISKHTQDSHYTPK